MAAENDPQYDDLNEDAAMNQGTQTFDFDTWASHVKRQMVASLKKRTVIYGDFWGNASRSNTAKAVKQAQKPEV